MRATLCSFSKAKRASDINDLQGFIIAGISLAETSSDVALITTDLDDSVVMPSLMPLGLEEPQIGENCLALGYSKMVMGEPTDLQANALFHVSSSRGKIEVLYPSYRDTVKITFPCFQNRRVLRAGNERRPRSGNQWSGDRDRVDLYGILARREYRTRHTLL